MINWAGRASMWGVGGTLASMDHFTISAKQLPNLSLLNTCQHLLVTCCTQTNKDRNTNTNKDRNTNTNTNRNANNYPICPKTANEA